MTFVFPTTRCFAVWRRNYLVWKRFLVPSVAGNLGDPLVTLLSVALGFGALIKGVQGASYVEFVAPGLIIGSSMYATTLEATYGAFTRLEHQKTWHAIVATPLNIEEVVAGEWLWAATKGTVSGLCVMTIMLLFGFLPATAVPYVLLASAMTSLFFAASALVVTSIAPSYDFFNFYLTGFIAPMYFFGGVFFPLSALPEWAQFASSFLPLATPVHLARAAALHQPGITAAAFKAGVLPVLGALLALAAAFLTRRRIMS